MVPVQVRAFQDGRNSWVDLFPMDGPFMRITHSVGGDFRRLPTFNGLSGLGAAPPKPKRNMRCISAGKDKLWCWNTDTGKGLFRAPSTAPAAARVPQSIAKLQKRIENIEAENAKRVLEYMQQNPEVVLQTSRVGPEGTLQPRGVLVPPRSTRPPSEFPRRGRGEGPVEGLSGFNCRRSDSDTVYCWDDTSGDPDQGRFWRYAPPTSPGMEGLRRGFRRRPRQ